MQDFTSKFKKAKENKDWVVYDEYMTLTSKQGVIRRTANSNDND